MKFRLRRAVPALFLFGALLSPSFAKKKEDPLDRQTPVGADQPIPVIDFFRPRLFTDPELNPAGTHFAALISTKDDRTDLIVFELATKKIERLSGGGEYDVGNYEWLGDRRLVYSVVENKLYATGLFSGELGKLEQSYVLQRYNVIIPVGFPRNQSLQMIVWIRNSAKDLGGDGGVIKIATRENVSARERKGAIYFGDADSGLRAEVINSYPSPKEGVAVAYIADRQGELAFAVTSQEGVSSLHRWVDGGWLRCTLDLDDMNIAGVGDAPGELLVYAAKEKGKPKALHRFDTATGMLGEMLCQDEKYDIAGVRLYRHPADGRLLGVQYTGKGPQSHWFDPKYAEIQAMMQASFPDDMVRVIGSDKAEKQFFISVSSDVRPMAYYHLSLADNRAAAVANTAPWIDPKRMQPMRVITYKARDGRDIEGYVTLPEGASKEKPVPLVVLPHGGPWVRDNWGWDAEVQFLASRGYAVFQPNYRGSTGYAWKFPEGDIWDFRKMHDDVTDGVKAILKTRVIDPDRIAIMGGSFGGYLALCGAVYEKDLYRCAITMAGVFDWERVMKEAKGSEYVRGRYGSLRRHLGDPAKRKEKFEEISPIKRVDQVKIPVFVAHGTEDVVATVGQSKALIAELKKYGVPYEKQIERGEGHGFHKLENQVELYTAIEAFLAKHLAPRKAVEVAQAAVPVAVTAGVSGGAR